MIQIDPALIENSNLDALAAHPGVKRAAELLRSGQLVAFPTETVYGLGADASDEEAANKIYQAKGRPQDNPLIVHIAKIEQLENIIEGELNAISRMMIERFWPGPLTLVCNKSAMIPSGTTAGLDSVAVRMPDHPLARAVIEQAGVPVAAPSANTSGAPSPTRAEHVLHDLMGRIPLILDGGPTRVGLESTVVDVRSGRLRILRPGGVSREAIGQLLEEEQYIPDHKRSKFEGDEGGKGSGSAPAGNTQSIGEAPLAPGMKYRHYSPDTPLRILRDERELQQLIGHCTTGQLGFVLTDETYAAYKDALTDCKVITMGPSIKPEIIAANLFHILRSLDELSLDAVYIEFVSESGIGEAVMNRLYKASRGE